MFEVMLASHAGRSLVLYSERPPDTFAAGGPIHRRGGREGLRISTWTYPWDLADEGVDEALDQIKDLGFDAIDLAANYHSIATLAPHNPERKVMYLESGAVFFPARIDRYGHVVPEVWQEPAVLRVWPAVADRLASYGLTLNSWTIGMFQPWLARKYPECARTLPFGDPIWAGTCPASPLVQEYLAALSADIAEQFPVHQIALEGIGFPSFDYGWVRDRIGIALNPWTRYLLGYCFCGSCRRRGQEGGVDVEGLQRRLVAELTRAFEAPDAEPIDVGARVTERRKTDADFAGYLRMREDAVTALVERIVEAVGARSRIVLMPVSSHSWVDGLSLERLAEKVGGAYLPDPATHQAETDAIRQALNRVGPPKQFSCNINACWPARPDSPEFGASVAAAKAFEVDQISFYNYGLVDLSRWRSVLAVAGRGG
jgi:hypothetical protein